MQRCIPLALFATTHAVTFALTSIFSSKLAATTNEASVDPNTCGLPDMEFSTIKMQELDRASAIFISGSQMISNSATYSSSCYYHNNAMRAGARHTYVQQHLGSEV